jgi:hypothetical protein
MATTAVAATSMATMATLGMATTVAASMATTATASNRRLFAADQGKANDREEHRDAEN